VGREDFLLSQGFGRSVIDRGDGFSGHRCLLG
jgi:hypothetical protein